MNSELEVIRGYCRAVSSTSVNLPSPPFSRGKPLPYVGVLEAERGGREGE